MMNLRSIHTRLILWYTALVIFISVGFGAYTYYSLSHRLYEEMQETLVRRAEHVRDNILPVTAANASENLAQLIQNIYSPEESNRFIRIARNDGSLLYVSGEPRDHTFDPAKIPLVKNTIKSVSERLEQTETDNQIMIVSLESTTSEGGRIIEMGAPTDQIDSTLRKLIVTLFIGLPVVVIIAIVGGSNLLRRALQPVEVLRATAEKITYSNLRQRLPVAPTGDALEHLAKTLNQMLERLDLAYQQASRFSADASHELRTPLTVMRSELESIESSMRLKELPMEFRDRIGSVLEEAERLSGVVEGLFAIARLDAGEAKMDHETVDLAELVRSTVEQMQLLADEKRISVILHASDPALVAGDKVRLKQVVVNLFDNAIKYTSAGGAILIAVRVTPSKSILSIKDNGMGVSADALPHVFERFYRADKVRSRITQGAGLGLSIVQAICLAHGGTVTMKSTEGTGTTVTVELPLAHKNLAENVHAEA